MAMTTSQGGTGRQRLVAGKWWGKVFSGKKFGQGKDGQALGMHSFWKGCGELK